MDRNYYYRILGLSEGATPNQIKKAYEKRMAKLDSADYRDDPEYVNKKKHQTTMAYKVLMGSAPPISKAQRKAGFERFKDNMQKDEEGKEAQKNPLGTKLSGIDLNNKYIIAALVIVVIIIISVFGIIIGAVTGFVNDFNFSDYGYHEESEIDRIQNKVYYFDYLDELDFDTVDENQENIDWEHDSSMELDEKISYILSSLDIDDTSEFFDYITGIDGFYYDHEYYESAKYLITWIGAPSFEMVAGSTSLYNGELILDIEDYLDYILDVIYEIL